MVYSYRVNNGFIRVFNYAANGNMLSPIYSSVTKHFISSLYEKETTRYGSRHLNYIYGETGIVAILVKTSTSDLGAMYYVHTDHLGSYNLIMDADKNIVDSLHFDPWGNRKRYNNWATNDTRVSFLFDRGFTGHEHLDRFKIINMNGRLYDPVLTRFFSPDPYVQFPSFTQNYNRYSYCLNNPLSYTDPSGYKMKWWGWLLMGMGFLDPMTASVTAVSAGATIAATAVTVAGATYGTTVANIPIIAGLGLFTNYDGAGAIKNSFRITNGLFATDKNRNFWARTWQFTSRFSWEALQTTAGLFYTQGRNLVGKVDQVEYFGGSTFAIEENVTEFNGWRGVSLGNYINAKISDELNYDYPGGWIYSADGLFLHEYGHTFDSQRYGIIYLLAIGIPSASGANWTEIRANQNAWRYAKKYKLMPEWFYSNYPLE